MEITKMRKLDVNNLDIYYVQNKHWKGTSVKVYTSISLPNYFNEKQIEILKAIISYMFCEDKDDFYFYEHKISSSLGSSLRLYYENDKFVVDMVDIDKSLAPTKVIEDFTTEVVELFSRINKDIDEFNRIQLHLSILKSKQ